MKNICNIKYETKHEMQSKMQNRAFEVVLKAIKETLKNGLALISKQNRLD